VSDQSCNQDPDSWHELVDSIRRRRYEFGRFLRSRRLACRMTQQDVADLIAVLTGSVRITRWDIARYERGKRLPKPETLRLLAVALNVPLKVMEEQRSHVPYRPPSRPRGAAEPLWRTHIVGVLDDWRSRCSDLHHLAPAQLEDLRRSIHSALAESQHDNEPCQAGSREASASVHDPTSVKSHDART
jgi:transcriptional regulator with XRE-family HTH domain